MKFDFAALKGFDMRVSKNLGIDLGTSNTLIYEAGRGIVVQQPTVAAVNSRSLETMEVGDAANLMLGKTSGEVRAFHPIRDGVIAEIDVAEEMLSRLMKKVSKVSFIYRPRVAVAVPHGITGVDRRSFEDVAVNAGARGVTLIPKPLADALGLGLKISAPSGNLIINIGGGMTEIATVSLGGIVTAATIRTGGTHMDDAIAVYIRRRYSVTVSQKTAEQLKMRIGSAHPSADGGTLEVRGKRIETGLPVMLKINAAEIREAIGEQLSQIVDSLRKVLEKTPPEICSDIYDHGIYLTGGCASLPGMGALMTQVTGIRTIVCEKPMQSCVLGLGKYIEHPERYPFLSQKRM
ncbi:MAG: rod shape-determining protein [Clostridia bacterium]|nr:rod shape-determining protein [Clostridia bacterium]